MALTKKKLQRFIIAQREERKHLGDALDNLDDLSQDPYNNQEEIENYLQAIQNSAENIKDATTELLGEKTA